QARSLQVQKVRDARRQYRHRTSREALRAQLMLPRQLLIVPAGAAHKHSAPAPPQPTPRVSRILNAVPAGLQKPPLLRIHALGFGRRDVEKQRIEAIVV